MCNDLLKDNQAEEHYIINPFKDTQKVTKTEQTKENYQILAKQLCKRISKEYGISVDKLDVRAVVSWLIGVRQKYTRSTFRLYKSCLIYYFTEILNTEESLEAAEYLLPISSSLSLLRGKTGVSKKAKSVNKEKYILLRNYLMSLNNPYGQYVIYWLEAGILCGLRPSEWRYSDLIMYDNKLTLRVKNSKNTNGRSNGDYRFIVLHSMNQYELNIITKQLSLFKQYCFNDIAYKHYYTNCTTTLRNANKKLFGEKSSKFIMLYSGRHQFSANAKASNLGFSELAALMGHATDNTATIHYGKRMVGKRGGLKVKPIQEQVNTVKKVLNIENLEKQKQFYKDLNNNKYKEIPFQEENTKIMNTKNDKINKETQYIP